MWQAKNNYICNILQAIMEAVYKKQERLLHNTTTQFVRSLMLDIDWNMRLIGIKGARGVGKSTLLLQYIKLHLSHKLDKVLYISLDNIWLVNQSLYNLADNFVKIGGEHLFIDEVHKYENWATEIKNIYDDFPNLKVVFTGSSLLQILNARADLSRRAITYIMQGLSYREFLNYELNSNFKKIELKDILQNHTTITREILKEIKPLAHFKPYLQHGYFPFYKESKDLYPYRINEVINMIIDIELPLLRKVDVRYLSKLKQLLLIIAQSVPFIPNVSKLSTKIGINRNTLVQYLYFLEESGITKHLYKDNFGVSKLQKPDKIYLENTNLSFAIAPKNTNIGNLRETFFINQLSYNHQINYTNKTDFKVDEEIYFEVGGKNKTNKQIAILDNAFIVADDIEHGFQNKIPLWLFGFLY